MAKEPKPGPLCSGVCSCFHKSQRPSSYSHGPAMMLRTHTDTVSDLRRTVGRERGVGEALGCATDPGLTRQLRGCKRQATLSEAVVSAELRMTNLCKDAGSFISGGLNNPAPAQWPRAGLGLRAQS